METFSALLAFLWGKIQRSPVNSPLKGKWRWALMFSLICTWTNGWTNHWDTVDLRHHRAHYDTTVIITDISLQFSNVLSLFFYFDRADNICQYGGRDLVKLKVHTYPVNTLFDARRTGNKYIHKHMWPAITTWSAGLDSSTWWRHQMETFSALLAICAGNSPVPGEFPAQRPVTRSFDVFFDLQPNKRLSKQWWGWWFETPSWTIMTSP